MNLLRRTVLEYLRPHAGHGDDMVQIWVDLQPWDEGSAATMDPASWGDWVQAYWKVRGVALDWNGQSWDVVGTAATVTTRDGEDPEWSTARPDAQGSAGDELREFAWFQRYVDSLDHHEGALQALMTALDSERPDEEIPGWADAV